MIPVATTSSYETRVSLAVDRQDRVWIGYEQGGPNWGKDFGRMVPESAGNEAKTRLGTGGRRRRRVGIPLYNGRRVVVKCYADGRLQQPAADPASAWDELPRPKSFARLAVAGDGRVWLLFRHHPLPSGARETGPSMPCPTTAGPGASPAMLADSDNLLDNRPAVVPFGPDGVLAVYSSDCRLRGASNMEGRAGGR